MMELLVGLNLARQMIEGRSKNKYRFDMQVSERHMAGLSMSLNPSNHLRAVQKTALIWVWSDLFRLEWERAAVDREGYTVNECRRSDGVGDALSCLRRRRERSRRVAIRIFEWATVGHARD
jgi:hypothetical protein